MASILASERDFVWTANANPATTQTFNQALVPVGRVLYSLLFIFSGISHFSANTINYALSQGVPAAEFLVPLSGAMAFLGGLSVLLGYKSRVGALLLILFLVPVTLMMHDFWNVADPMMRQMQMGNFMKNTALLGASILIFFFGAGPYSLERKTVKIKEQPKL